MQPSWSLVLYPAHHTTGAGAAVQQTPAEAVVPDPVVPDPVIQARHPAALPRNAPRPPAYPAAVPPEWAAPGIAAWSSQFKRPTQGSGFAISAPPATIVLAEPAWPKGVVLATPAPAPPAPAGRSWQRWAIAGPALALAAIGAMLTLWPAPPAGRPPLATAVFAAPSLVLRAASAGRVQSVSVTQGQAVQPDTVLLTIRADTGSPPDLVVRARLRGYVRGLQAVAGAQVAAGTPLAELVDCGHAFLVPEQAGSLQAGTQVDVHMPGAPPYHGLVRPPAGISEPPGGLVIEPAGWQDPSGGCPLGAAATLTAQP